ncbi:uncharacterized protein LOC134283576 [Saccostrea cucullata]|uniref:uncharacterized protein LOC134283576 n=1 Tax=Saccostrea cuccullata TaxID=36930 RepID=UPI002ED196E2
MYPSEQSGRRLRAWQQKVNIFLAFAYDIGTASETQFKLRVIHDLICNVCIPYPETIERVLAAANDIKKIEFFFQNNAWQGVTDFVLALSTADIPRETQLKCLSQFAFRCITFDETNYQPCIVVIKAVFEKCHCEGELPLEPISIGAVLDECCFDINKRLLDKTIKALKFSSFVQEHCVLREILKVCESKKNIGPILLVADFIEHRLLSENSHLLNTDILLQSKEGSPILDELFDMRAALSNPDLDWTEELFIICFLRRFIFYSAKALTKDTEKERHLLKQLEKLFNFNNVKCQKQDNILKKLQIYLMRCISNGSSSYSIFQKVAGWRKSFETTLFPDLTEEKIKSSSDVYQPVAMNLAAFVRIKQEFQIEEKLTKSIFQHFINTELTGVVLYLYSHCYIGQIFSKQSGEETLLDVDVLPLAEIQKRILDCFILKKTYALDQIKIFKNCSSEALKHNSFISMILIWSAFLANKNNILLEAIEHPDFFESTMFCEFLQSRVYHCDTLSYIFSCENRHRVCALQCDSCPICFRGEVNRQFKNRQLQTKMTDKRKTVAYELIKLIFLGVHLSARALNHDINISDEENDDINDRLLCRINAQWSKVSSLLSLTENEVLRLCSLVFGKLQNEESLTSPDAFLNEIVEDSLKNRFLLLDKEWHDLDNHNSKVQLKSYKLSTFVETESQTSELILRRDFCPTLDNLLGEIELQNLEDKYPILYHILNRLYFLKLMRFLAPCLKWHRTIAVLGSFYLKKSDCRRMTVKTFLANEMGQNHSLRLGVRFCEFMKIWNELSSEKYCEALLAVNKELQAIANASEDEQLENFLIIDEHSPLLLTIEALVKIQNSFLDEIMDITCSGQCLATSFITKYVSKECIACFPIIPVLELQESDIIQSEFPHDCLIFSQRSLTTSRRVAFDFQKIEGETALYFLLEAKYIQLERQKLRILFKDDIAQSSVALLKKLLSVCPQSDAKDERIKKVLSVLASNQAEENYNFLTILGIAIAMIPKLPMIDPDTILLHFFQNRKNDFSFISFENAVPPEAKMGDLVMIYQWLEETNGTRVLENLDGEFKKEPPKDLENILIASRSKSLEWKSIVKGMKLFAQRRLSNKESLNLSQQLNSYMNDESFWPVTLVPTDRKKLCNLVPSDIKLKHIWVFYKCIEQHIKPRLQTSTHHEPRHMFDPNKRPQRKKKFRS